MGVDKFARATMSKGADPGELMRNSGSVDLPKRQKFFARTTQKSLVRGWHYFLQRIWCLRKTCL